MYLVDTNVWLELLLEQDKADEVRQFFQITEASNIQISEFSLNSIGVILFRLKEDALFKDFISDTIEDAGVTRIVLTADDLRNAITIGRQFNMDFDDAYQYVAADKHGLTLISFDKDFDRTERGRKTPGEIIREK